MNNKKLSLLSAVTTLSIFSSVSIFAAASCTEDEKNLNVLRSSWIDEDLAFLGGRKSVGYMFENNTRNYRIYQEGAFLGNVVSDPFYQEEIDTANELITRLNSYVDLKLNEVSSRREADLVIIGVCEDGNTTGLVADNEFGDQYYLLLNGCNGVLDVEGEPVLLFLHELGHAMGLEHPFDASDGDCLHSDEPWSAKATDASVTVMAYRSAEKQVGFYTDLDLATLQSIHGAADGAPRNYLSEEPDVERVVHMQRLNTTCTFETSIEYGISDKKLYADPLSAWGPLPVLTVVNSVTARDEAEEDKNLATLSTIWTRVGEENVWSIWAGDYGDLLTIHSMNEPMGEYTATLQASNKLGTQTYVGTCVGKF